MARWYRICLPTRRCRFDPWVRKTPWRRKWQPTPVFLPGQSHRQRSLVGYSPWDGQESDVTWRLYNNNTGVETEARKVWDTCWRRPRPELGGAAPLGGSHQAPILLRSRLRP